MGWRDAGRQAAFHRRIGGRSLWREGARRAAAAITSVTGVVAVLFLLSFALPVPLWRSGERALTPLAYRGEVLPLLRMDDALWTQGLNAKPQCLSRTAAGR